MCPQPRLRIQSGADSSSAELPVAQPSVKGHVCLEKHVSHGHGPDGDLGPIRILSGLENKNLSQGRLMADVGATWPEDGRKDAAGRERKTESITLCDIRGQTMPMHGS